LRNGFRKRRAAFCRAVSGGGFVEIGGSGFEQSRPHFGRAFDARKCGQIDEHAFDNRRLRQNRAEEPGGRPVFYKNRGEILNVKIVETIRMRLDIDPREADIGVLLREHIECGAVLAARPAPFRAQTRNEKRFAVIDALGDPFRVDVQIQRGHGGFLR
jgi:hypothetical protein